MRLKAEGLYGAPPVLNASVSCPPAIGAKNCESFAVLGADCVWRNATATLGADGALLLKAESTTQLIGSRVSYANWPVVTVTNKAGVPLLPCERSLSASLLARTTMADG